MRGGARQGAGRKPNPNKLVNLTLRIPADLKEQLSKLSTDEIREILRRGVESRP